MKIQSNTKKNFNMSVEEDSQCPWGSDDVDLRNKKLTADEISWLAQSFITGRLSAKELFVKYKLYGSRLHRYVQKSLKGEPLQCRPGQPPKLDSVSLQTLVDKVRGSKNIEEEDLRENIRAEYRASLKRKFPNEPECLIRRRRALSSRTVKHYSDAIRTIMQDQGDVVGKLCNLKYIE